MDEREQQKIIQEEWETNQTTSNLLFSPPSYKKLIVGIAVVFVLAVGGAVGAYFVLQSSQPIDSFENSTAKNTFDDVEGAETSDWQTYKNEEYGFEVKYPNTFSDRSGNGFGSLSDEGANVNVSFLIYPNPYGDDLDSWIEWAREARSLIPCIDYSKDPVARGKLSPEEFSKFEILPKLSGRLCDKKTWGGGGMFDESRRYVSANFLFPDVSLGMGLNMSFDKDVPEKVYQTYRDTFKEMLGTFKFVTPTHLFPRHQLFTNKEFGFSFLYAEGLGVEPINGHSFMVYSPDFYEPTDRSKIGPLFKITVLPKLTDFAKQGVTNRGPDYYKIISESTHPFHVKLGLDGLIVEHTFGPDILAKVPDPSDINYDDHFTITSVAFENRDKWILFSPLVQVSVFETAWFMQSLLSLELH